MLLCLVLKFKRVFLGQKPVKQKAHYYDYSTDKGNSQSRFAFRTIAHWIKIQMLLWFALMISWSKIFTYCPVYVFKKFHYFLTNQTALFTRMQPIRSTEGSSTLVSVARDLSFPRFLPIPWFIRTAVEWLHFFDFYNLLRTMHGTGTFSSSNQKAYYQDSSTIPG